MWRQRGSVGRVDIHLEPLDLIPEDDQSVLDGQRTHFHWS